MIAVGLAYVAGTLRWSPAMPTTAPVLGNSFDSACRKHDSYGWKSNVGCPLATRTQIAEVDPRAEPLWSGRTTRGMFSFR